MRHASIIAAAVLVAAACSDRASLPSSPLSPRDASFDVGTPPPPPVAGEGRAELDVSGGSCSANTSFDFSYEYLLNKPGNNAFLHMDMNGHGPDVEIHQNKKIDAHGSIAPHANGGEPGGMCPSASANIATAHVDLPGDPDRHADRRDRAGRPRHGKNRCQSRRTARGARPVRGMWSPQDRDPACLRRR